MRHKIRVRLEIRARCAADRRAGIPLDELRTRYPHIRIRGPLGRNPAGQFWRAP